MLDNQVKLKHLQRKLTSKPIVAKRVIGKKARLEDQL
jgi:hypothetical protein